MKFKLFESLEDKIWYHISDKNFDQFQSNWQGIHLSDTEHGAYKFAENRSLNGKNYFYSIKIIKKLKPLFINLDPMGWGGIDIAKLLLAKINNTNLEGATGEDFYDIENDVWTNYRYDISPNEIHFDIDKLSVNDIELIKNIATKKPIASSQSEQAKELNNKLFNDIVKIIEKCGYNSITYPLAEDNNNKTTAIIVWDGTLIKILNKKEVLIQ